MGWRLALSLDTLRTEFNIAYPRRSKASDGTIGDPAHRARASRHNPNRHGVVAALDITHDPASGCDVHAEARRIANDPHPELAYIISNRQIASRVTGFGWRPYSGSNPHTAHAHFAVGQGPDSDPRPPYDSQQPWGVQNPGAQEDDVLKRGDSGNEVRAVQADLFEFLRRHDRYDADDHGEPDGDFGGKTEAAVKAAQALIGYRQTGVYDLSLDRRVTPFARHIDIQRASDGRYARIDHPHDDSGGDHPHPYAPDGHHHEVTGTAR